MPDGIRGAELGFRQPGRLCATVRVRGVRSSAENRVAECIPEVLRIEPQGSSATICRRVDPCRRVGSSGGRRDDAVRPGRRRLRAPPTRGAGSVRDSWSRPAAENRSRRDYGRPQTVESRLVPRGVQPLEASAGCPSDSRGVAKPKWSAESCLLQSADARSGVRDAFASRLSDRRPMPSVFRG